MYVTISGVSYFSYSTWGDHVAIYTWADFLTQSWTWGKVAGPTGGTVQMRPEPSIRDLVEDRSVADFSIFDENGAYSFSKGEYVSILDLYAIEVFAGFIDEVRQERVSPSGALLHHITCVDNHYISDKRILAKGFDAATYPLIEDCVNYIINTTLTSEGITAGTVTCTVDNAGISFDYVPCSQALDELATLGGCTWYIDLDKKLYFHERSTTPAAWDITEVAGVMSDVLWEGFNVTSTAPEYRNFQYIKGGKAKTALQTEIQVGDGEKTAFPVGYPIAEEPDVYVSTGGGAYVLKTMGIKGVETGKDWYWSAQDQIIIQDVAGTRLTSADKLKIEYYGLYDIVSSSANYAAIEDRAAVEGGGTGIVEAIRIDTLITDDDAALNEANKILDVYAQLGTRIEYTTTRTGLNVGTLQHITSTIHGIDDDFLITQMTARPYYYNELEDTPIIYYDITAVNGPVEDYWAKVFLKMSKPGSATSISASQAIVLVSKAFDHYNDDIWACPVVGDNVDVQNAEVPGFNSSETVTYISLWDTSGVPTELFRKYLTAQSYTAGVDQFVTTFYLTSGEANFHWDEIRLYGGDEATSTLGTGIDLGAVVVDPFNPQAYTKNSLEALQIVITTTPTPP